MRVVSQGRVVRGGITSMPSLRRNSSRTMRSLAGVSSQPRRSTSFTTMLPVGVKDWEWTLYMPIEAFVTRRERLALADNDYQRIGQQLVQSGLDLVRDVRVAYADFVLAAEQTRLAQEAVVLRQEISEITQKRFADGEISELETANARIDLLNAEAALGLRQQDVVMTRARLAALLGQPHLRRLR